MEKKKMKKTVLSLGLVATLGVGATLAYFTGVTDIVTNTFDLFGTSGSPIQLRIDEHAVDVDDFVKGTNREFDYTIHETDEGLKKATPWLSVYNKELDPEAPKKTGVSYNDLLPGQIIDKDPTVYVAEGSAECWVVAKVTGLDQILNKDEDKILAFTADGGIDTNNWTDITDKVVGVGTDERYYLYYKTVTENDTASEEHKLPAIFTQLQVKDTVKEAEDIKDIEVNAAAAQAKGITKSESITQALKCFNDDLSFKG